MKSVGSEPTLLVNHLGYGAAAPKSAILAAPPGTVVTGAHVRVDGRTVAVAVEPAETVHGWGPVEYRRIDLSLVAESGIHLLEVELGASTLAAEVVVGDDRLPRLAVSDITAAFRAARSSGEIDRKDAHARFYGDDSGAEVDARGGWLDASGDYSKFLSHLTYTRMMSPQQIPLCAWAMMAAHDELARKHPGFVTSQRARLRDEGLFGADFLMRFRSPDGYFYTAIFDALTKDLDERVITAPLQDSVRTQRWQAAYRHGGGLAIAALARASTLDDRGEHPAEAYLDAARRAFDHLEQHNEEYLFDGAESVIDDYCALLAAAELAAADSDERFVEAARRRVQNLRNRWTTDDGHGHLIGDRLGRPYFHAAESGLPAIALARFAAVLPDDPFATEARALAVDIMAAYVARTDAVPNPFGYPRQLVQDEHAEAPREAFFFPHDNETGYWWQGENANLGSVAVASSLVAELPECGDDLRVRLGMLAADCLAWVGGLNPFDSCMLQGRGRGNVEYLGEYQNSPGAIVNGITSHPFDESGIAFLPEEADDGEEWRWAEQWIPHSAWFLLAVCVSP
ncbi:glycoside hydrolase family 9 protein [Humibacter soli]